MPLVSLIIPFYNQIEFLHKCLASASSQTLRDIEIIVVDDGSEEDPGTLIESFQDERIRLIRQMNSGVAHARNNAIAKSNGSFLVFLDADDWLAPSMVEELVERLSRSNEYDFAYCDVTRVGPSGEKADDFSISSSRPQLSGDILPSLITGGYFPPASVLVRASAIAECGGFDSALGGCCDWDLWIRLAASGKKALFHDAKLAFYRLHDKSMSKNELHMQKTAIATLSKNMREYPNEIANSIHRLIETSEKIYSANSKLLAEKLWLEQQWKAYAKANQESQDQVRLLEKTCAEITSAKEWLEAKFNESKAAEVKYLSEIETLKRNCEQLKPMPVRNTVMALTAKMIKSARRLLGAGDFAHTSGNNEKLLKSSPLFDASFYLSTYADVANAGIDPVKHYLEYGGIEGRQPSKNFDGAAYLQKYDDVRQAGLNPLVHYLRYGRTEGRSAIPSMCLNLQSAISQESKVEKKRNRLPSNQPKVLDARRIIRDSGLFDAGFYCKLYPDIDPKRTDPFEHYFNHGGNEGRRPSPFFDGGRYMAQYPDVVASEMHPLVHYITIGKDEGRIAGPTPDIISTAKQMIKEAGMIEPTILLEPGIGEPEFLPVNFGGEGWTRLPAWQKLFNSLDHAYDCLIFVPWLVRGGADLAAVNAVKASIENLGLDSVLLVVTDYDRKDAFNWLPPGTHVRVFSDFDSDMGSADRTLMTELLIRAVRPKSMLNVNSRACWDAMVQKGGALSKVCDLYAFLFCRDYTADGRPAGYADTHFRAALPFLRKVYFDNSGFMKELSRDFGIPEEFRSRLVTLHQPISADKPGSHKGGPVERNKVFWASRFSKQKNVELLIKIVEAAPDINFDIYGYGDLYYVNLLEAGAKRLPNLNLKGQFSSITDLPINNYNALLYTSLWDGLPLTLVDLAAMGVPIVASSVGGIPDFIDAETGWAIEAYEDPMHYVQALQHVLNNPDEAHLRSARMVERVITAHSWQPFKTTLSVRPSFAI